MYVYLLQSIAHPTNRYVGITSDLKRRLAQHNQGLSHATRDYKPWRIQIAVYFRRPALAEKFETYLKGGSGRAFSNRHFW